LNYPEIPRPTRYELPPDTKTPNPWRGVMYVIMCLISAAVMVMFGFAAAGFVGWVGE